MMKRPKQTTTYSPGFRYEMQRRPGAEDWIWFSVLAHVMPFGFLKPAQTTYPILANLLLVALWGAIHSVMARDRFKAAINRFIPEPAERPTYVGPRLFGRRQ